MQSETAIFTSDIQELPQNQVSSPSTFEKKFDIDKTWESYRRAMKNTRGPCLSQYILHAPYYIYSLYYGFRHAFACFKSAFPWRIVGPPINPLFLSLSAALR
ncbi:hypothetical protein RND71_023292 [Anisodus tanguticus]|uniref:Uncharacterized protein n=1 Tax=Anisodus tanguticus TaxID=243964 RepID=A0AAE1V6U2_9SOLA|nr:hypothetical protein RND71_023292 [Anisodus tanguticus]